VPDDQLSLAIGRRGQNVRLASMLTEFDIDIMTEEQESEKRQAEFNERSEEFMKSLDVDEVIARLLVTEGFTDMDEVAYVPVEELAEIEGFDEEVAEELRARARAFLAAEEERVANQLKELGIADDLRAIGALSSAMLVKLGEDDIKTREDFAGLAADELTSREDGILRDFDMTEDEANELIMAARVAEGWITQEELDQMAADAAAAAEAEASADLSASA